MITVGEVQAVLSARDTLSPALVAAAERVNQLTFQMQNMGKVTTDEMNAVIAKWREASAQFAALSQAAQYGKTGLDDMGESAKVMGQQLTNVEGIAMRLVERMILLYAIRTGSEFVAGLYTDAAAMVELSQRTDMSVGALQTLKQEASSSNVPFNTVGSAVEGLNKRLADLKPAVVDTLEMGLNISLDQLFSLNADQRFREIADSIAALPSPLQRTKAEVALFGTDAIDPLIVAFGRLSKAAKDSMSDIDTSTTQTLAVADKAFRDAGEGAKMFFGTLIEWGIKSAAVLPSIYYGFKEGGIQGIRDLFATDLVQGKNATPSAQAPVMGQALIDQIKAQQSATAGLTAAQKAQLDQLKDLNALNADNAAKMGVTTAQLEAYNAASKIDEEEQKKRTKAWQEFQQAWADVKDLGDGWKQTVASIDQSTVQWVKDNLAAGASLRDMQVLTGLTAAQIRDINKARLEEAATAKQASAEQAASLLAVTKLQDEYASLVVARSGSTIATQIANEQRMSENLRAEMIKRKADTSEFEEWREKRDKAAADNIIGNYVNQRYQSRQSLQGQADDAAAAYNYMMQHGDIYTQHEIENAKKVWVDSLELVANWEKTVNAALDSVANHGKGLTEAQAGMSGAQGNDRNIQTLSGQMITATEASQIWASGGSFQVAAASITAANKSMFVQRLRDLEALMAQYPGRAPNGSGPTGLLPNDAAGWSEMLREQQEFLALKQALPGYASGGSFKVGEHGEEIVTISPSGYGPSDTGTGGSIIVNVNVSGVFDPSTKSELTHMIVNEIERVARQGRRFPAAS